MARETRFAVRDGTARAGFGDINRPVLTGVVCVHLAALAILYLGMFGGAGGTRQRESGAGRMKVIALSGATSAREPVIDRVDQAPRGKALPQPGAVREQAGVDGDGRRDIALGESIAGVLADDPLGGADGISYEAMLRRHIARHRQYPDRVDGRVPTGIVVVRVNIDRDGRIIDARVMKTQGASLDEAALSALWRAEPMPSVPIGLPAPIEIEVPVDFRRAHAAHIP